MTFLVGAVVASGHGAGFFGWVALAVILWLGVLAVRCFTMPSPK